MAINRRTFLLTAAAGAFAPLALPNLVSAQAAGWFPLLGPETPGEPIKVTPEFGIRYNARGFDHGRRKRIDVKTPRYLHKRGASHLIDHYRSLANMMVDDSGPNGFIPSLIDLTFDEIRTLWIDCGGIAGHVARAFNPRVLTVEFKATPFWSPDHRQYLNGTTDGRNIRTVAISSAYLLTNPSQAYLIDFRDILGWEFGNTLALAAGIPFTGVGNEIGDRPPCEMSRPANEADFRSPSLVTA